MDRSIVYSGELPQSADFLFAQRASMIGLAKLSKVLLGGNTWVEGLNATPGTGLNVVVGQGQIYQMVAVDSTAYGVLTADTTDIILKQGIILTSTTFSVPAPTTSGQSINYLIEAAYQDVDGSPAVLPYYNAANPSQPLSGQNNNGLTQNTRRLGQCVLQIKAGTAATSGSQTTPAPDAGYTGIWIVTVPYGASSIASSNIVAYTNTPFVPSSGIFPALQANAANYALDTGTTANNYVASISPAPLSIPDGFRVTVATTRPNTGASYLALNGTANVPIQVNYGASLIALVGGEIINEMDLVYATAGGAKWILLNPANYARTNGDSTNTFQVANATVSSNAVPLGQADGRYAALNGSSSQVFNVANAVTPTEAVALGQFTSSKSAIAVGSATAAHGTLGSTGWRKYPDGIIEQWATMQLYDNGSGAPLDTWTFPIPFPNAVMGMTGTNLWRLAGQSSAAQEQAIFTPGTPTTTSMPVGINNTQTVGTLCWFLIKVFGY